LTSSRGKSSLETRGIAWRLVKQCVLSHRLWDFQDHPFPAFQLHINQEHPDVPVREHVKELISKLEELGVKPSPEDDDQDDEGEWEDYEGSDGSESDVVMS